MNYNTVDLFLTMFPLYLERVLFNDTELGAPHCDVVIEATLHHINQSKPHILQLRVIVENAW